LQHGCRFFGFKHNEDCIVTGHPINIAFVFGITASGTIARGDLVGAVYNSTATQMENQTVQTVSNEKYAVGVAVADAVSGGIVVVEIISTQFWGGPQPKAT
jgi:hypothetical protein